MNVGELRTSSWGGGVRLEFVSPQLEGEMQLHSFKCISETSGIHLWYTVKQGNWGLRETTSMKEGSEVTE